MTTLVRGPIKLVTDRPDTVRKINLRAPELRLHGAGIVTDHNDDIPVRDGQVEFEALPGPAVLTLVTAGGAPLRSVDIVVPDEDTATLAECLDQIYVYEPPVVGRAQQFAREAGEHATTAQEIATNLPTTIQNELDDRVPEALSTDQTIRDAATLAVNDAVDAGLPGKADTSYVDAQDQALGKRIDNEKRSKGFIHVNVDLNEITEPGVWTQQYAPSLEKNYPVTTGGKLAVDIGLNQFRFDRYETIDGRIYVRRRDGAGNWWPWIQVADSGLPARVSTLEGNVSSLASQVDSLTLSSESITPVSQDWVHWGDSLTDDMVTGADAWVNQLAAKTGRTHSNQGWYGQSLRNIAARAGALQPIITVEGGSIPAAGGTVTLSSVANMPTTNNKRTQIRGVLAGREGYLSTTSAGVNQFTATSGDGATSCPPKSVFTITDPEATTPNRHVTIWAGFNDRFAMEPWEIVSIIGEVVERHTVEGARRVMVFQLPQSGSLTPGSGTYQKVADTNRLLEQAFPTLYLPICDWLQTEEAAQVAGVTFTEQDRADIANGIVPTSFRSDYVHFNAAGCTAIAAYVHDQAAARGWVAGESIYSSMRHADTPEGDEMFLSGTGFPEGKVSAPVGATYTDTAATAGAVRWIKTAGTGATGWQVEYGDTGWRDVSSALSDVLESGKVLFRRRGDTVDIATEWAKLIPAGTAQMPAGFRPFRSDAVPFYASANLATPVSQLRITYTGNITIHVFDDRYSSNDQGTLTTSDPWPSSLPGTPA